MFDNGLELVRADFHLHTRKDKEFIYRNPENSFVNDYVESLKESGIKVGVITNHNKFDKDEYKAIKKKARKDDIFILPGVELSIKEGANCVHTLIVFNPEEWIEGQTDHINNFLAGAFAGVPDPYNKNVQCNYDVKETIKILDSYKRDYFIIFAHVDQKSGLFYECKNGLLETMDRIPSFKDRVLGLQKSRNRDNLNSFQSLFKYSPALVEGSDPKSIDDIGKGDNKTYLKVGEYSFSAIKFALLDSENRISDSILPIKHGYIRSISFEGGKLAGNKINFSHQLNTLIGIRGSGKSTILEVIRYVFELPVYIDDKYKNDLIKAAMGSGGKVTVDVTDKHGKQYSISRIFGERPHVFDESGNDIDIRPLSLFDGFQYFGQKDLSSSTNHEAQLLEKLTSGKVDHCSNLDKLSEQLDSLVSQILKSERIPDEIAENNAKLSDLEHKMKIYSEKGVSEKLKKQTGYVSDKQKLDSIILKINKLTDNLSDIKNSTDQTVTYIDDFQSQYNSDIFGDVKTLLSSIDLSISHILGNIEEIQKLQEDLVSKASLLNERIESLQDEFAEIKREISDDTLDVDGFVQMTQETETIKENISDLQNKSALSGELKSSFLTVTRMRNDVLLEQFTLYQKETDKINRSQDRLKIDISFKGDREGFAAQIKKDFTGTSITESKCKALSQRFSDYVSIIEDWIINDGNVLKEILGDRIYGKFDEKLRLIYKDLIRYQVNNSVEVTYHDKPLRKHSIGQRASALILFILTQKNNDLIIIDQPEDDLDNKVIYDEVIKAILDVKDDIQFIFATHNANIPVLGDAERVIATEFKEPDINVVQGNIDLEATHFQIINIMEGGKEAFEKRHLIYTSWR